MIRVLFFLLLISMKLNSKQILFFIHGINSSPEVFSEMTQFFKKDYKIINWSYNSVNYDIPFLADNFLKPRIDKISRTDTINFITHSMGALVLRAYLKNNKPKNFGKIVMIAPPNNGSEVADFFYHCFLYKLRYKKNAFLLTEQGVKSMNLPDCSDYECGIIAGTSTQLPFFSIFIKGEDDGKISVKRTKLNGMKDFIKLHYPHDTIMRKKETIFQCSYFLKHGRFDK